MEDDESEGDWYRRMREESRERKRKRDERIWPTIRQKIHELGQRYDVVSFNDQYQVRIGGVLDVYPQNKRYHIVGKDHPRRGERGSYSDLLQFVDKFFKNAI